MSSSSKPSILTHPDILIHSLHYADKSTLTKCMRVSWSFFDLSSPLLYSNLSIIPNEADSIFKGASTGSMIYSDCTEREMKRDLLKKVKILNINKHEDCSGFSGTSACTRWRGIGIEFPSLEILRIYDDPLNPYMGGWYGCPWIPYLTPNKLLIRDTNHISACGPFSFAPTRMMKQVKKIVVTVRGLRDLRAVNKNFISSFSPVRDQTIDPNTEVVFIFWKDNVPSESDKKEWAPYSISAIDNIIEQVSICALVQTRRFIICNIDKIAILDKTPSEVETFMQNGFKEMIEGLSNTKGESKKITERLQVIEYMSFKDYLQKEDWKGEFDKLEVESWLE